nr:hypothetical protein [Tanacetum cinerariifolium]
MRTLLTSTSRRTDIPEAYMPPQKRACLTTPALGFKIGKSSAVGAARDRPDHHRTSMLMDREAMYAREAWAYSVDRSAAIAAHVRTLKTQVAALIAQTLSLQTQLTTTLGRIEILEARDLEPQEGPAEAGSSWTFVYLVAIIVWHVNYYGSKKAPNRFNDMIHELKGNQNSINDVNIEEQGANHKKDMEEVADGVNIIDEGVLEGKLSDSEDDGILNSFGNRDHSSPVSHVPESVHKATDTLIVDCWDLLI